MFRLSRVLLLAIAFVGGVQAQTFPQKPVKIVVPYAPGGGYDIFARALAQKLSASWGQQVFIENRAGASEIVAAQSMKREAPDGHTLFLSSETALATNPVLFKNLPYDPAKDLEPVVRMIDGQFVFVVRSKLEVTTFDQFLRAARSKTLSYGSAGPGSSPHLAFAWLATSTKTPMTHVPYKGVAPAVQDMLTDTVDSTVGPVGALEGHIKTGQIRAIAVTGGQRVRSLPNVPTLEELGLKEVDYTFYLALLAPAQTPIALRRKIATDVSTVLRDPEFLENAVYRYGYVPVGGTPEQFANFLATDSPRRRERVTAAKVTIE